VKPVAQISSHRFTPSALTFDLMRRYADLAGVEQTALDLVTA